MFCLCFLLYLLIQSLLSYLRQQSCMFWKHHKEFSCITAEAERSWRATCLFYWVLMRKRNRFASGQSTSPPPPHPFTLLQANQSLLWQTLNVCVTSAQLLSTHWDIVADADAAFFNILQMQLHCKLVQRLAAQILQFDIILQLLYR